MTKAVCTVALLLAIFVLGNSQYNISDNEEKAKKLMVQVDKKFEELMLQQTLATWQYNTNITDYNQANEVKVKVQVSKDFEKLAQITNDFDWQKFRDPFLRRQFYLLRFYAVSLSEEKEADLASVIQNMTAIFSNARICNFENTRCNLTFGRVFSKSKSPPDPEHIKLAWLDWHKAIGPGVRDLYQTYVDLMNEKSKLANFSNVGEEWLDAFEVDNAEEEIEKLWEQVKPFYLQLHAYIRFKLKQEYPDLVSDNGPMPLHLTRSIYGDNWIHFLKIASPYPKSPIQSVTEELRRQNYTPLQMFHTAENFFTSINMNPMTELFWKHSILQKPKDGRRLICHSSAWNLYHNDVRIKLCTNVVEQDFVTIHHEMGHVQYYLQYEKQPAIFRQASNPGFHEAIGDVIALSVLTPKHLKKIGLIKTETEDQEHHTINNLFKLALTKIALLPFSLLVDKWRWNVFRGKIKKENWNCGWWELVEKYQGLEPPADRSENDFEPGAKYHVVADDTFVKYFAAIILQFQILRSLCLVAGEYDPNDPKKPLHNCDIYGSTDAGNVLMKFLEVGNSIHWHEAMKIVTGQEHMDGSGLLEYFKPLHTWLEEENKKNGVFIGWEHTKRNVCSGAKRKRRDTEKKE